MPKQPTRKRCGRTLVITPSPKDQGRTRATRPSLRRRQRRSQAVVETLLPASASSAKERHSSCSCVRSVVPAETYPSHRARRGARETAKESKYMGDGVGRRALYARDTTTQSRERR